MCIHASDQERTRYGQTLKQPRSSVHKKGHLAWSACQVTVMKCGKCGVQKLSNEFPPWTLVESCNHAALHCLRCVTSHAKQHGECSQCENALSPNSNRLEQCVFQLKALFPEYQPTFVPKAAVSSTAADGGYFSVAMLNGDSTSVQFNQSMTVAQLKEIVRKNLNVPLANQQLVYNGTEMKDHTVAQAQATLGDYQVQPKTTIHVRRLLYSVPTGLDKVVFDLYWGYPVSGIDFLDASVLIFNGTKYCGVLDYRHTIQLAMTHSGDVMDDYARKGHHLIKVNLQSIPSATTHLFFTLSAWCSPNISKYPNPSLRFYEQSKPDKMLCEDTITKLNYSQAIVMGWLARQGGNWCVFTAGKASAGNAANYSCLVATIQSIITKGM